MEPMCCDKTLRTPTLNSGVLRFQLRPTATRALAWTKKCSVRKVMLRKFRTVVLAESSVPWSLLSRFSARMFSASRSAKRPGDGSEQFLNFGFNSGHTYLMLIGIASSVCPVANLWLTPPFCRVQFLAGFPHGWVCYNSVDQANNISIYVYYI